MAMSDQQPDWVAQLDQARAGLADMGKMLRSYYQGAVDAGFDPEQAIALTCHFQGLVFAAGIQAQQQGE